MYFKKHNSHRDDCVDFAEDFLREGAFRRMENQQQHFVVWRIGIQFPGKNLDVLIARIIKRRTCKGYCGIDYLSLYKLTLYRAIWQVKVSNHFFELISIFFGI